MGLAGLHAELPDHELVSRVKQGHKGSFEILFRRYNRRILAYIQRNIGNYQKAEDLTQDTFLKALRYIHSYKEKGRFCAWLYTIASNLMKNELRSMNRRKTVSLDAVVGEEGQQVSYADRIASEDNTPDQDAGLTELGSLISQALTELKPKYRQVVVLCDIQEVSYEEAAEIMGCSIGTVGSRLSRARKMLGEKLKNFKKENQVL